MPALTNLPHPRTPLFVLALVLALAGSGGCGNKLQAARKALPKEYPATVSGWNDDTIDRAEFLAPFTLNDYERVVVAPLDTSAAPMPPKGDNHEHARQALNRCTLIFTQGVENGLRDTGVLVETGGGGGSGGGSGAAAGKGRALVLRGKVVEMDPGSRTERYWVGFGAGAARAGIAGEVVEAGSGRTLLRFEHVRGSAAGAFGGDYAELLDRSAREVGQDVGLLIAAFSRPDAKP